MFKHTSIFHFIKPCIALFCIMTINTAHANPDRNWAGSYLGIHAGGSWGHPKLSTSSADSTYINPFIKDGSAVFNGNSTANGFTSGIAGGYNLQFKATVLGLALDFNSLATNNTRTVTSTYVPGGGDAFLQKQSFKTNWLFTLRPRLGYAIHNLLFYFTGGLTAAQLKGQYSLFDGAVYFNGNGSKVRSGWTLGTGIEYKLEDHWSVNMEYLYANLGKVSVSAEGAAAVAGQIAGVGDILKSSFNFRTNIIRTGLHYHF